MPPIELHTESPISTTAAKASGVTPQTARDYPPTPTRTHITTVTSLKTDSTSGSPYPAARPGAIAFPGPTATPQRYQQPQPTATTPLAAYNGPPPPQPNPFPRPLSPYSASPTSLTPSSSLPPPPRAGERPSISPPKSPLAGRLYPVAAPPNFSIPPPTSNFAPTHSTQPIISPVSPTSGAANLPFTNSYGPPAPISTGMAPLSRQHSGTSPSTHLSPNNMYSPIGASENYAFAQDRRPSTDVHPSGYTQHPRASEMTASQRAALELDEAQNGPVNGVLSTLRRGSDIMGGSGNGSSGSGGMDLGRGQEVVGEALKGARRFFGSVAEKAMEVEGEVWKAVGR